MTRMPYEVVEGNMCFVVAQNVKMRKKKIGTPFHEPFSSLAFHSEKLRESASGA